MIPPLFAIFTWQAMSGIFFATLSARVAVLLSILGAYLLLPEKTAFYGLPGPGLDKDLMTALVVMGIAAATVAKADTPLSGWFPKSNLARLLIVSLPLMAIATNVTNGDALNYGPLSLPGLPLTEIASVTVEFLLLLVPMFLGRRYFADPEGQKVLLIALAIAGLLYSLPTLWEVRMSPHLHETVYGFFQHDWRQHVRGDGFRPIMFLQHGLWVSLFFSTTALAALALVRADDASRRLIWFGAGLWLLGVLFLTKSLGAWFIALLFMPVLLGLPGRAQLILAAVIASTIVTYPLLRGAGVVPVDTVVRQVAVIDNGRALSLGYRLNTEETLLQKVEERPLFGWGRFGRNFVFDPETGNQVAIADGYWIIRVSQSGWFGYLAEFGLLCGPLFLLAIRSRRINAGPATTGLAIVLVGNVIDLIPNAGLTPITWLLVGALYGRVEYGVEKDHDTETAEKAPNAPGRLVPVTRTSASFSRFGSGGPLSTEAHSRQTLPYRRSLKEDT